MSQAVLESDCLNCGAELSGDFCHVCGQKAASTHLGWHEVFHEVTHEFLHLDGKIVTSLKALVTRPGQLTKDIVEGRRARYVTPLRLYLTTSVLFFLLAATLPSRGIGVTFRDDNGQVITTLTEAQQRQSDTIRAGIVANGPKALFVLMPVFALLTLALYRRRQPHFAAHLYFSLHAHAFTFLVMAAGLPLRPLGIVGRSVASLIGLWVVPYYYLALRRFFGESWGRTVIKGTAIGVLYLAAIVGVMAGLAMVVIQSTK